MRIREEDLGEKMIDHSMWTPLESPSFGEEGPRWIGKGSDSLGERDS